MIVAESEAVSQRRPLVASHLGLPGNPQLWAFEAVAASFGTMLHDGGPNSLSRDNHRPEIAKHDQ